MMAVEASIEVAGQPERVWKLMSDPSRYPEWVEATQRMLEVSPGEFGLGSIYREYGGIPPFLSESEWKVVRFEPNRIQVHEGSDGKMRLPLRIELTPSGGGTRLSLTLGMVPTWYLAPLTAVLWPLMMRRRAQQVLDASVANARRLLEEST